MELGLKMMIGSCGGEGDQGRPSGSSQCARASGDGGEYKGEDTIPLEDVGIGDGGDDEEYDEELVSTSLQRRVRIRPT